MWWQLKDEYARCKWSEQCHISASSRWFGKYGRLLLGGICLTTISSVGIMSIVENISPIAGQVIICISLIVSILSWATDQQYSARLHNDAADCYYALEQQYITLMLRIKSKTIDLSHAVEEHNRLAAEQYRIACKYPKTGDRDYANAKKIIMEGKVTFGEHQVMTVPAQSKKTELDVWFSPELLGDIDE
ncbi:MAG: SLATT domain-containing protein [Deltaproteobacteria bacterium]|nr:SLATT domain-containing protein [Deltaproteobacteria bacterium]